MRNYALSARPVNEPANGPPSAKNVAKRGRPRKRLGDWHDWSDLLED